MNTKTLFQTDTRLYVNLSNTFILYNEMYSELTTVTVKLFPKRKEAHVHT